ncbi:hypothetical protein Ctob_007672 [Chrysochromulina tobinii]|uniref:Uncharacterized protein n=1 Tax=Chrysochromulina tobinii TaxID=1460289 RepID=A0A0M0JZU7_9EUKA|nr:hypothetical protein Ctob_007672 [Chrysochromulina tobinii]|eukprot:KOO32171.1 hypothetical protein Ctob_007672 [Chrysochromulina sp. CCMP291]
MDKDKDREKIDRDERERGVKEQAKAGKEERDKFERDAKEQAAREKAERDKFERDAKEQAAREKAERERADKERERAERERLARDKAERERLEREAKEHAAREKAERERLERAKEQARKEEAIARKKAERERAERERLLKHQAYVGTPTAANTAPLLPLPQCVENVVPSEVSDLIFGTFLCALLVGAVGFFKGRKLRKQQNRAMHRSLSCPALVELKSTRAVKACADMLAAFDERSDGRRSKPAPYVPSMPRVAESAGENSNAWSPRSVGKSTVIAVLEGFAASNNVLLSVVEGKPTAREALVAATPLVVWDAVDEQRGSLKEYVARHLKQLTHELASKKEQEALVSRLLVLCNKSDLQPCPIPELRSLDGVNFV